MIENSSDVREISLANGFGVVVKVNDARVEVHADRRMVVYANDGIDVYSNGPVRVHPAVSDTAPQVTPEIGVIEREGDHKGQIYGGIWSKEYGGDNKPIWFSAAPKVMDHYKAAAWAEGQGGSLPTRKQGDYLTTLKGKLEICPAKPDGGGAFTEIFNRGSSFPAGFVWLAEPYSDGRTNAWCQRLSDGDQDNGHDRNYELSVLSVRR